MLEINFEKKCLKWLRSLPQSYWPNKEVSSSERGKPDLQGCIRGHYIALEIKREEPSGNPKGRLVLQLHTLQKIEDALGYSALVYPGNWMLVQEEILAFTGSTYAC